MVSILFNGSWSITIIWGSNYSRFDPWKSIKAGSYFQHIPLFLNTFSLYSTKRSSSLTWYILYPWHFFMELWFLIEHKRLEIRSKSLLIAVISISCLLGYCCHYSYTSHKTKVCCYCITYFFCFRYLLSFRAIKNKENH